MDDRAETLTEDETREVMSCYEERLGAVITTAIRRWNALPAGHAISFSPRTRASVIHDFIVAEATVEFLPDPHVTVSLKRGTVVLVFAGKVAVRFKKLRGARLQYSIGPTRRQRLIHHQQLTLDGTDVRLTWATAGYRLDAAGGLAQAALVVNTGDVQQYAFDLSGAAPALPVQLPVTEDDGLVIRPAAVADGVTRGTGTP